MNWTTVAELLPWIKQWHNEIDPEFHQRMGDYFEGFLLEEARRLGRTVDEIRAWQPPPPQTGRDGGEGEWAVVNTAPPVAERSPRNTRKNV